MRKLSVLIVEDQPALLRGIKDNFEMQGYEALTEMTGDRGLEVALASRPDLLVLDVMLPKMNGFEVCRRLREEGFANPIIMLTAKDQESDIVQGLNLGADDYVTKPFSIRELLARANAFLRRKQAELPDVRTVGDYAFDTQERKLTKDGEEVSLTPKEAGVLELLTRRPGRVVTRDVLLDSVWGFAAGVSSASLERCVSTVRSSVERVEVAAEMIVTVRDVGYRFEASDA